MAAPRNNRFAAKAPEQRHDEILYVRLRKSDKDRIVDAAGDAGLASWVREALLQAAGRDERDEGRTIKGVLLAERSGASKYALS